MLIYRRELAEIKDYPVAARTAIKMDANELPFSLPQAIQEAILARYMSESCNRYPGNENAKLRSLLAESNGLSLEQVAVGNGSSELLQMLCYIFGGKGRHVVYPVPSFSMYDTYIKLSGGTGVSIKLTEEFAVPAETVIDTVRRVRANLLILCSPNNPTGNAMSIGEIEYITQNVSCPVIIDEAYFEFCGQTAFGLLQRYPNLIIVRTFSKAFGLAAARVGYLFAAGDIVELVNKGLLPYNMNVFSLIAATEAYKRRNLFERLIAEIVYERERVFVSLKPVPELTVFPSVTNFLLVKTADAEKLARKFATHNIGVRTFSQGSLLDDCIRLTIGLPEENDMVLKIVYDYDGVVV